MIITYLNRWLALIIGVLLLGVVAACGTSTSPDQPGFSFRIQGERTIALKDGRTVTCVTYKTSISCDWEHAK